MRRGVIYAVGISPIDPNTIWGGTDDGLIHLTRDGGRTWTNVTPPQLMPWAKVSILEASHFDLNTAYAAINTLRLDDLRPYIYRTRDGGRNWTLITQGLPDGAPVNAVKEDTQRRGLLFAGSERAVHVSFDDGEHWQSLRLNMPATSVRDLVIKDDDLVVATHGRGFWILDDITPLRQLTADVVRADAFLFRPGTAWRFRWNKNTDTPLPPDEPAAPNPPDGVTISYLLSAPLPSPSRSKSSRQPRRPCCGDTRATIRLEPPDSNPQHSGLLDSAAAETPDGRGTASVCLGCPVRAALRRHLRVSDCRGRAQHAQGPARPLGDAGYLSGTLDHWQPRASTGRDGEDGSARADTGCRSHAAVHVVSIA